jgi:hypothetical protein
MVNKRILYHRDDGTLAVLIPCVDSGMTLEAIAAKDVPAGKQHAIVDVETLPSDFTYAAAWAADLSADPVEVTIDPARKAAIDKEIALQQLEQWFSDKLHEGFSTGKGWKLGMLPTDVTLLTGNYVLAKEAAALGGEIPPVIDAAGGVHAMSMDDLTLLMLGYGQARAALSAEYASRKAAIATGE